MPPKKFIGPCTAAAAVVASSATAAIVKETTKRKPRERKKKPPGMTNAECMKDVARCDTENTGRQRREKVQHAKQLAEGGGEEREW